MIDEALFSDAERSRYHRQVIMADFGPQAQEKLKRSRVLVVGAGGLGSPVLLYLAAAGVGHLGIIDCDAVDESNLHRQVLFGVDTVGKDKVAAARERLRLLNPFVEITTYPVQLTSQNALELIRSYDVVADGTDNFPTRYLVNDACVLLDKPNVYASIYQFEGQVAVFNWVDAQGVRGPNYRDLYPHPPEPGAVANCAEAGVLGVLPGIVGSMQALEVIKVITGIGEPLSGKLCAFDALSFELRTFRVTKNPANPLTGDSPTLTTLIDYEQFCGVEAIETAVKEVEPTEFLTWQEQGDVQVIDVREPDEYEIVHLDSELLPLATLADQVDKIARDKRVVVLCKTGRRSSRAIRLLEKQFGYTNLYNLKGGILNYIAQLGLELPVY